MFYIENTLTIIKNRNILIDLKNKKLAYISNIYDKDYLIDEINSIVSSKYSNDVYEKVKNSNVDNHTYIIDDNKVDIYFNDIISKDLTYVPMITIKSAESVIEYEKPDYTNTDKNHMVLIMILLRNLNII